MKVMALRGVCIGVDRHLVAGQSTDLDAAMVQFLVSIGAVEVVKDAPPVVEAGAERSDPPADETRKTKKHTEKYTST